MVYSETSDYFLNKSFSILIPNRKLNENKIFEYYTEQKNDTCRKSHFFIEIFTRCREINGEMLGFRLDSGLKYKTGLSNLLASLGHMRREKNYLGPHIKCTYFIV